MDRVKHRDVATARGDRLGTQGRIRQHDLRYPLTARTAIEDASIRHADGLAPVVQTANRRRVGVHLNHSEEVWRKEVPVLIKGERSRKEPACARRSIEASEKRSRISTVTDIGTQVRVAGCVLGGVTASSRPNNQHREVQADHARPTSLITHRCSRPNRPESVSADPLWATGSGTPRGAGHGGHSISYAPTSRAPFMGLGARRVW